MKATSTTFSILCVMALLVACGGGGDVDPNTGPIKIGAVFDLSGPTSDVGTTYANGIRGYVDWVNANGGIDGREVDLLFQDYAYKPDQAAVADGYTHHK